MSNDFQREDRYLVLKHTDAKAALDTNEQAQLAALVSKIDGWRRRNNKDILQAVVVEHDWPEYEPTWKAIERRVPGQNEPRPPDRMRSKVETGEYDRW